MRKQGLPAVAVLTVAAGLAIAGATARPAPSAAVSQQAATVLTPAMQKLVATGVLPTDVRAEPGVWNYAGPTGSCPGPGWKCVVLGRLPLTQIGTVNVIQCVGAGCVRSSQTGVVNTFTCEPEPPAGNATNTDTLQECVITQGADFNRATCEQKKKTVPFVKQRCSITQTGMDNDAKVVQLIEQTGGNDQGAVQEAGISQTATASKNALQVHQEIKQFTQAPGTQNQDAYQVVGGPFLAGMAQPAGSMAVQMGATGVTRVDNQAQIDQKQSQRAEGGATLDQNDGATDFTAPADCNTRFESLAIKPNACVNLEQTAGSGDNQSQLNQAIENDGVTTGAADQQQGSLLGGIDGRVHQDTTGSSSSNQANLSENQTLHAAPGSTQSQIGPGSCCGFGSQVGPGSEQIQLKAHQHASEGEDADQVLVLHSTSNSPDGTCAHAHDASNNADETSESFTFDNCSFVTVATECTNPPPPSENGPIPACTTEEVGID